ncbi:ras association domain-containing protein 4a isoform X1 [Scyliorhinus canicula]|uniref:ras association domain-containing protein 4a isoform X1 n=2 Tax=Scyliorhinus canicula TaxID=7830 RepID=UPI0018F3EE54|nr:ras association domain-containing protein 4a isoform X1 [Scyliorhinus canicula]XP_038638694.1 ras association domain-containing protein 4a isoform X1 [Scyliorhinus canicula]XP_038638695.1 ras association domain-containing protein 4a isoform X1 [Scyliorhinus canicula]XP_038638696.1 ras association domain-containing protein 4a isoform X1 [Scyliorhinus canicula]XP_038638697.1 ras association domain-containing protein 4a isoform X1 [Scyliorhinus canicula]XP_038638700.1 ras association domain-co
MEGNQLMTSVKISEGKCISKSELLMLLKTYNCYQEGKSFQLRHREDGTELIIEGLLNISWGLRRPIRLQMHDDNERICFSGSKLLRLGQQTGLYKKGTIPQTLTNSSEAENESTNTDDFPQNMSSSSIAECDTDNCEDEVPQLMRTKSDASSLIQRRTKYRTSGENQRIKRHRFSINGHFYNHKTSVFTPAYGSVTNVRVNSSMNTSQVLNLLLNKFRVENTADEFALYVVHESGERTKLKDSEYPLISRILHGPCEKIARIFLMEKDLGEEVTYDVAQYIKFEMPVLDSFVEKLKEEEEREINKLTVKYSALRSMIHQQLEDLTETEDTI